MNPSTLPKNPETGVLLMRAPESHSCYVIILWCAHSPTLNREHQTRKWLRIHFMGPTFTGWLRLEPPSAERSTLETWPSSLQYLSCPSERFVHLIGLAYCVAVVLRVLVEDLNLITLTHWAFWMRCQLWRECEKCHLATFCFDLNLSFMLSVCNEILIGDCCS